MNRVWGEEVMNVKKYRQPSPTEGRWQTIQSAMDSWSRTARLCLISGLSSGVPATMVMIWLGRH